MLDLLENTPIKILIIDDEMGDILLMQRSLVGLGEIYSAANGAQGLDQLARLRPDIVLLDIEMPDIRGTEVAEQIRRDYASSNIRIIFVTSHKDDHTEYESYQIGADDYLTKPFNMRVCRFRVERQIESRKLSLAYDDVKSILDTLTLPIILLSETLEVLYFNVAVTQKFGRDKVVKNESIRSAFGEDFAEHIASRISAMEEQDKPTSFAVPAQSAFQSNLSGDIKRLRSAMARPIYVLNFN